MSQERFDHDGFWKDLIERFWGGLLKRALPELWADADLAGEPKSLDKELADTLQTMASEDHEPPRFVDELMEIPLKGGGRRWALLHIEVEGRSWRDVPQRMMRYFCLIFSHYGEIPVALAILTSARSDKASDVFEHERYGTELRYRYGVLRLKDLDDAELLASDEPFDLALYAAKKAMAHRGRERKKFKYLWELTRLLADKGWSLDDRRAILLLIARAMDLRSPELRRRYIEGLEEMGARGVEHATFIEEHFTNKGMARGMAQGMAQGKEEGKEEGRRAEKLATASRLWALGLSEADIQKATELTLEDLRAVRDD